MLPSMAVNSRMEVCIAGAINERGLLCSTNLGILLTSSAQSIQPSSLTMLMESNEKFPQEMAVAKETFV